ncbi:glycosyltransferase family 4 protein [Sphingomonas ginkgonis]|uniref:glycosyltransferase family 4 protein n=1 Tax=Sphingomonas ginkgonis TaxID=2315330 RepID=UPI00163B157A|nr:glycosyltransferase family 1 protein [Sphingomonas ginkgonis]
MDALAPQMGGIGRYTLELVRGLPSVPGVSHVDHYAHGRLFDDVKPLLTNQRMPKRSWTRRWRDRRQWQRLARSSIVHAPNYFLPRGVEQGVMTVHDLSVFRFPETHPAERIRHFEKHFLDSLVRARRLITDTATVRDEIVADFGIAAERIKVVPLGVSSSFRPHSPGELAEPLRGLGLQAGRYTLCVSTIEPRKRIAELLRVWRDLPAALRADNPLVLAGGPGWRNESIMAAIAEGEAAGWLTHCAFVPEALMPALYAGAKLFIYPSIYEGFGLPPIEAMASGVPVIAADRSCMPEVCGAAARYTDPDDHGGFRNAVCEALEDGAWLEQAAKASVAHAAQYSWRACVEATAAVYAML